VCILSICVSYCSHSPRAPHALLHRSVSNGLYGAELYSAACCAAFGLLAVIQVGSVARVVLPLDMCACACTHGGEVACVMTCACLQLAMAAQMLLVHAPALARSSGSAASSAWVRGKCSEKDTRVVGVGKVPLA